MIMNLPTLVTLTVVLAYPMFYAAFLSLHKVTPAELRRGVFLWVGLGNYKRILSDPLFILALEHTLIFTVVAVIVEIVLAIAIALLIDQRHIWTSRVTKVLILVPYAVPPIANGLIWSFIYNFDFGFLTRSIGSATRTPRCSPSRCPISGALCPSRSCSCTQRSRGSAASFTRRRGLTVRGRYAAFGTSPFRCCGRSSS
jgi:ABC-type Fe3+ transport system permease subunit